MVYAVKTGTGTGNCSTGRYSITKIRSFYRCSGFDDAQVESFQEKWGSSRALMQSSRLLKNNLLTRSFTVWRKI
jgi:hypothetical protein